MGFFKKYNGTTDVRLMRLERITWALIYGGLLSAILGLFLQRGGDASAPLWMGAGSLVTLVGVVLIYVRSRLRAGT